MVGRLRDKVAVITGSSRGIGKGIARIFAAEGARVLLVARDEKAGAQVAEEIHQGGGLVGFCRADVSSWPDVQAMARAALQHFGQLDILVSNAGVFPSTRIEDMSEGDWEQVQNINLKSTFFAVKAALQR